MPLTIFDAAIAVFVGNMMTVMVIYGAKMTAPYGERKDIPIRYLLILVMPVVIAALGLYSHYK